MSYQSPSSPRVLSAVSAIPVPTTSTQCVHPPPPHHHEGHGHVPHGVYPPPQGPYHQPGQPPPRYQGYFDDRQQPPYYSLQPQPSPSPYGDTIINTTTEMRAAALASSKDGRMILS
ncbi:hypothetical protein ACP4OV_005624 [Aristida adscensionis]